MASRRNSVIRLACLAVILALGLGLRAWGLTWGLWNATVERRPQPDEWVVYWLFRWFRQYHSLNPCPSAQHGQCFFDWGAIYPYLAYLVHAATLPVLQHVQLGPRADPAFMEAVLAGRLTSVLASGATIIAVYLLARSAYGPVAGLLAALLTSLSGLLIELAHFATPDSTTVLLCTLTLLAAMRYLRAPSLGRASVAGILAGLAAGSEYHMVLLAIPLLLAWSMAPVRRLLWLVGAIFTAAAAYIASNPYIPVEFSSFEAAMLHTLRIRTIDSAAEYGNRFARYGPAWLYPVHYVLGYGAGAAATAWLLFGAAWSLVSRHREDILLLSWIVPYTVLISISSAKFLRYGAPILPPLAVLGGRAAADTWLQLQISRRWLIAAVATAIALYSVVYDAAYVGLYSSPDPRLVATRWLAMHTPLGSRVGFGSLPDGVINLPYFTGAAGYRPCFTLYKPRRLDGPIQFMLVDNYTLEEHSGFSDMQVAKFYGALRHDPRYQVVASINYLPTFLGLSFPLAGSPHDWRYAAHRITIYRRSDYTSGAPSYCFPNISAAIAALYVPSKAG